MKESRHANFGAIQAIFLQLSWSQHKLAHSCQGRGQRSNGAINRNIHFFRSFCRGISNLVTPSLTVAELGRAVFQGRARMITNYFFYMVLSTTKSDVDLIVAFPTGRNGLS